MINNDKSGHMPAPRVSSSPVEFFVQTKDID